MKYLGIVFVLISSATVGFQMAESLKNKCSLLRCFLESLNVLEREIAICGTPLPQAFARMAGSSNGVLAEIYSETAKSMDRNPWVTPYDAVRTAVSDREDLLCQLLLPLFQKLGKYDTDAQKQAVEAARRDTETVLEKLTEECHIKSRTYRTLGICTGLAVAILLV